MELINHFIGVTFAWVMLGIILLPLYVGAESLIQMYVKYATDGQVEFTSPLMKLWNRYLSISYYHNSYVYKHDLEPHLIMFYSLLYLSLLFSFAIMIGDRTPENVVTFLLFSVWEQVGTFLAPILLVISAATSFAVLSRKVFKFKAEVEEKLKDKQD